MANYGAPVKVSPLVKGGRWIGLISGYFYGKSKLVTYSHIAEGDKKRRELLRKIREEEAKEMKRKRKEEKMAKCGCNN